MRLSPRHVSSGMRVGVRLLVPERRAKTFKRRVWEERERTPALASSRRQGFGEGVPTQGTGMRLSPRQGFGEGVPTQGTGMRLSPRQGFGEGIPTQGTGMRLSPRHVSSGMCVGVRLLVPERCAKTFKRRVWEERCVLWHLRPADRKASERDSQRKAPCACLRDMFCRGCVSEYVSWCPRGVPRPSNVAFGRKGACSGTCVQQIERLRRGTPNARQRHMCACLRDMFRRGCVSEYASWCPRGAPRPSNVAFGRKGAHSGTCVPAGDKVLERESRRKVRACACLRDMFRRGCVSEHASWCPRGALRPSSVAFGRKGAHSGTCVQQATRFWRGSSNAGHRHAPVSATRFWRGSPDARYGHAPVSATCFVGDACRSTPPGAREARQDLQTSRLGGKVRALALAFSR